MMAALLALWSPPLPPSGPISGSIQCLLDASGPVRTASLTFDETAPAVRNPPTFDPVDRGQVQLSQMPVDGNKVSRVQFNLDGSVEIYEKEAAPVVRFTFLERTADDRAWMSMLSTKLGSELKAVGTCIGQFRGRSDRPISLTKISTFRID